MKRMRFPIAWENVIKQKKKTPKCTTDETNRKLIAKSLSIRMIFRRRRKKRKEMKGRKNM